MADVPDEAILLGGDEVLAKRARPSASILLVDGELCIQRIKVKRSEDQSSSRKRLDGESETGGGRGERGELTFSSVVLEAEELVSVLRRDVTHHDRNR